MLATFPRLLLDRAERHPNAAAMRVKEFGIWQTYTWFELAELVRHMSLGLMRSGMTRGDHVVIVGDNRPRLYAAMLAVQAVGAVPIPLYQAAAASEYVHPIESAQVAFAIVEDQEQVDKLLEVREACPKLRQIWFDSPRGLRKYAAAGLSSLDELVRTGAALEQVDSQRFVREVSLGRADDPAAIFFTSGTTGKPKGVVHTHAGLLDRALAGARFDKLTSAEEVLAYLPPAWIGQNIFSFAQWLACGYVVNCPEAGATVQIDLREIGPTYYFAPPAVFEGLLTSLTIRLQDAGAVHRWVVEHFMRVARRVGPSRLSGGKVSALDRLLYALGDLLVYGPLRNSLGMSRVRVAYTAGEAIGPDLFNFYRSIGVNLKQLYGSTETAVFVCMQPDHEVSPDTVGVPIQGVELRIDDNAEILVRSPGVLKEYHRNPEATAEAKTPDGWYRSGDAGFIDAAGHLRIIDRIKDVGRLRGGTHDGALFAPKHVENKLRFFPYIKEAVAFGDGRETVGALINIDPEAVGSWAERRNLSYAGYADLTAKPEVHELIAGCIEQVNAELATDDKFSACQIHRFFMLHKELDADDGEMTRSRKVRRAYVSTKYAVLIDAMYRGAATQTFQSEQDPAEAIARSSVQIVLRDAKTFSPVRSAA
jgi:long-chain acyl-CoA synthetase